MSLPAKDKKTGNSNVAVSSTNLLISFWEKKKVLQCYVHIVGTILVSPSCRLFSLCCKACMKKIVVLSVSTINFTGLGKKIVRSSSSNGRKFIGLRIT